uniref:CloA n=1 Tax=Claviceps gigantea TaxID=89175 RepID=A0A2H4P5A3_9HYPO|nr:CloA [Claviceps gigantea]
MSLTSFYAPNPWLLLTASVCVAFPWVMKSIYNLYFHPLRNVPGPRLAALTNFYAFYWNWIREGGYSKQFSQLHQHYNSPVIRIGPNSVHTNQIELYDVIFKGGSAWLKDWQFYQHFNGVDAMIGSKHFRTYRDHLAPLYAQRTVDGLAPKVRENLELCAARISNAARTGKTVNLAKLLRLFSTSVILYNIFSVDISLYEDDGFHPFLEAFEYIMAQSWLFVTYPMMSAWLSFIPGTIFSRLDSSWKTFMKYCTVWNDEDVRLQLESDEQSIRNSHSKSYFAMKREGNEEKNNIIPNPVDDVFNFISGGSDTTAYTIAAAFFYILSSPPVCAKLVQELDDNRSIIRDDLNYNKIKGLPYLNAVIKETLRIAVPLPGCLPRVVPKGGIAVGSFHLPAGTSLSLTHQVISFNEEIFPSSQSFLPQRWLGPDAVGLDKWNVAFSRGPRQCIGTTLAYLEVRCALAYFFSRFQMTLTGSCGDRLRWVDRFVAANVDEVEVRIVADRWTEVTY